MLEFETITKSEGTGKIYQKVGVEINLTDHPDFLKRPIKILDIGGGTGAVGDVLKSQCEESLGPLSEKEFLGIVDYANLDIDYSALEQSLGRTYHQNIASAYDTLREEEGFDYVLTINPNPFIPYILEDDSYVPKLIRMGIHSASDAIKLGIQRISLISTALLLGPNGKYIFAGFMTKECLDETKKFIDINELGLKLRKDEEVEIDERTKDLFIQFDTKFPPNDKRLEELRKYYTPYRIFSMTSVGLSTKNATKLLEEERKRYMEAASYLEFQDRFGSW